MEVSQVLNEMAAAARQVLLQEAMKELIVFVEENNYSYSDILKLLSVYTKTQSQKDIDHNPNWAIVSHFLESALSRMAQGINADKPIEIDKDIEPLELIAIRGFSKYFRQNFLLYMVSWWTEAIQGEKFRLSDLLNSLKQIAQDRAATETETNEDREIWQIVVSFLEAAANAAEQEGREIP